LVGVLVGVMIVELLNSAVEAAVDRIGEEHHELAGRAKDIGSAAVLMSMALVVLVWGAILGFRTERESDPMSATFSVIFRGDIAPGATLAEVRQRLQDF